MQVAMQPPTTRLGLCRGAKRSRDDPAAHTKPHKRRDDRAVRRPSLLAAEAERESARAHHATLEASRAPAQHLHEDKVALLEWVKAEAQAAQSMHFPPASSSFSSSSSCSSASAPQLHAAPGARGGVASRAAPACTAPPAGPASQHLELLRKACSTISSRVPGFRAEFAVDASSGAVAVWLEVDLARVCGLDDAYIQRLGVASSDGSVVFMFEFAGGRVHRSSVRFIRCCAALPEAHAERQALIQAARADPLGLKSAAGGPVHWLLGDRVKHKFAEDEIADTESLEELLINLGEFVGLYISHAPTHCLMCDRPMPISMPKPCVCDSSACIFQSRELGLGFSIEEEILNRPQVVELLLTFFSCSLLSRRDIDLQAIPKKIIENSVYAASFTPLTEVSSDELSPNELTLFYALGYVPPISEMINMVERGTFKTHMDGIDTRLYPLLQWLIGGCRSFIRVLEPEKQFPDMCTPHQFVFDFAAVEKEARFQAAQDKVGTFFAFHGSSAFAWNSIISTGLKNLSNTDNMSYGAMKGSGIYFSTSFHTSLHYAKPTKLRQPWVHSGLGRHPRAIALCEIVDRPEMFAYSEQKCFTECTPQERANGQLHVVPQEDFVQTRYLFVYNEHITPPPPSHHIFALRASVMNKISALKAEENPFDAAPQAPSTAARAPAQDAPAHPYMALAQQQQQQQQQQQPMVQHANQVCHATHMGPVPYVFQQPMAWFLQNPSPVMPGGQVPSGQMQLPGQVPASAPAVGYQFAPAMHPGAGFVAPGPARLPHYHPISQHAVASPLAFCQGGRCGDPLSHDSLVAGLRRECLETQATRNQEAALAQRVRHLQEHIRQLRAQQR